MKKFVSFLIILLLSVSSFAGPYEESRKAGIDAYNKGNYEYALKCFQSVLKIAPSVNDLASWIEKCKRKINDSSNATNRPSAKKTDSYYIELAKKSFLQKEISKAENYLDRVDNRESVDYCLLKGDILYLYKFAEYGWRSYYNHAAYLGNQEAIEKTHNLIVDSQVSFIVTPHPKTTAEFLAHKADSLIASSWSGQIKSLEESFNLYLKSAEMDHPTAQLNVGRFYLQGYGTNRNYQEAFNWITKAANSANSTPIIQDEANCILAWFYSNGICTAKNEVKAYELIKKQTIGYSGTNNGLCNEFGKGTNVNKQSALYLYRNNINYKPSSSSLNYEVAMERYCYLTCIEHMEDTLPKNGKLCYEIALGMTSLSNSNYTKKEYKSQFKEQATILYDIAYKKGVDDNSIKNQLGNYFRDNKQYDKAVPLYESASIDNKYSCYNLGEIYENGYGVTRNYSKAKEWYLKAKEMGHYSANDALKRLSKKGY